MEKFITLENVAELLRVSRHTVQAWVSPSSPNHRPEFALLARHAGRKTVFVESEIILWLNQRRGPMYAENQAGRSAYWRERFIAGRGLLKGLIKEPDINPDLTAGSFSQGILALDADPLLVWLSDGARAAELTSLVNRAEGLMISVPLAYWLLRRMTKSPGRLVELQDFLIGNSTFELAPLNEDALRRSSGFQASINDLTLQGYCCCVASGADSFLSSNRLLLKVPGVRVTAF